MIDDGKERFHEAAGEVHRRYLEASAQAWPGGRAGAAGARPGFSGSIVCVDGGNRLSHSWIGIGIYQAGFL